MASWSNTGVRSAATTVGSASWRAASELTRSSTVVGAANRSQSSVAVPTRVRGPSLGGRGPARRLASVARGRPTLDTSVQARVATRSASGSTPARRPSSPSCPITTTVSARTVSKGTSSSELRSAGDLTQGGAAVQTGRHQRGRGVEVVQPLRVLVEQHGFSVDLDRVHSGGGHRYERRIHLRRPGPCHRAGSQRAGGRHRGVRPRGRRRPRALPWSAGRSRHPRVSSVSRSSSGAPVTPSRQYLSDSDRYCLGHVLFSVISCSYESCTRQTRRWPTLPPGSTCSSHDGRCSRRKGPTP